MKAFIGLDKLHDCLMRGPGGPNTFSEPMTVEEIKLELHPRDDGPWERLRRNLRHNIDIAEDFAKSACEDIDTDSWRFQGYGMADGATCVVKIMRPSEIWKTYKKVVFHPS